MGYPHPHTGAQPIDALALTLRITSAVLAVIFALLTLRHLVEFIPSVFSLLRNLLHISRMPYSIISVLSYLTYLTASLVMCLTLLLAAVKWDAQISDLAFLGALLSLALRLITVVFLFLRLILMDPGISTYVSLFVGQFVCLLGYALAAGILFLFPALMGCAPLLGKSWPEIKHSAMSGWKKIFGR